MQTPMRRHTDHHPPHQHTARYMALRSFLWFAKQHYLAFIGSLTLLVICGSLLYRQFNPIVYHLTMTTGSFSGENYALVMRYLRPAVQRQHVELTLIQTEGSENALDAVQQGRIQLALVDGGLSHKNREDVREIAPLFLTALHMLMRHEIYDAAVENHDLRAALRGKSVSLSTQGSGTHTFVTLILERLGIATSEFVETPRTISNLTDPKTTADQVPDIVFSTSSLPSPVARRLVQDFGYRLYPLDFVDAVRLDDKAAYPVTIPAGTYSLSPSVPSRTVTTIGRRTIFVAHKDVPDEAVAVLTRAAFESDFAKAYDPPMTLEQFNFLPEFPRHPGVQAFLDDKLPISQEVLQALSQYIGLIGAIACIPPCIIMLHPYLRRLRRGIVRSVRYYLAQVSKLEARAFALDETTPEARATLLDIRRHLNRLKLEAMDAYHQDRLDDVDLMASFLAHVNDLRSHLNGVIAESSLDAGPKPDCAPPDRPEPSETKVS